MRSSRRGPRRAHGRSTIRSGPGLAAWFEARGCAVTLLATLPDDRAAVSAALAGVACDLLVTIGGASVGDHDVVKPALPRPRARDGRRGGRGAAGQADVVRAASATAGACWGCPATRCRRWSAPSCSPPRSSPRWQAPRPPTRRAARASPPRSPPTARANILCARRCTYDADGGLIAEAAADQDSSLVSILASAGGLIRRLPDAPPAAAGDTVDILMLDRCRKEWRSGRDSNPRWAFDPYSLSRRAPSTTRPPLRMHRDTPGSRGFRQARASGASLPRAPSPLYAAGA